jgi:group II intron reverse transcriptase/maturase
MNAYANTMLEERAQELVEKLYLAAKRNMTRRFHALYDKIYRMDFLGSAWKSVKRNRGSSGIDGESIADIIESGEGAMLEELQRKLREGRYRPRLVKRVYIPKSDGRERPLGIPTVRDRVVQTATKNVIEPIFEADFLDCSYGFRPNRCAQDALEEIRVVMNAGYHYVLDADIKGFFDNINHDKLLGFVSQRINDRRVLKLIRKWLKSGVLDGASVHDTEVGTPQGGVISPLLANIYLHELDLYWTAQTDVQGILVRYADDFVILFRSAQEARKGIELVKQKLSELDLELNETKSKLVDMRSGKRGFDFLGFYHRRVKSPKYQKYFLQKWPSTKSVKAIKSTVKQLIGFRWILNWNIDDVVTRLNPTLRGWMNYFRFGNSSRKFNHVDMYVHERMGLWWSKKHQKRGRGWTTNYTVSDHIASGIQRLSGNVEYWEYYRMRKKEGHRKAV